jgi:hypothetical protein
MVNSVSEGFFGKLVKILIFLVVALIVFGYYSFTQFRGLKDAESMEYAQLARNMSAGKGYTTSCIRPADMWFFTRKSGGVFSASNCQDIRNPPFFPAVLSLGFKLVRPSFTLKPASPVFEPETSVIVPVCIFFIILTGLLVYLIALRLFNRPVAIVSTLIFFLSKSVLDDSISGLPASLIGFLATSCCYAAISFRDAKDRERPMGLLVYIFVSAAILSTAAFLASYKMIALVPVMAFFMVAGLLRRKWLMAGAFLLLVFLMISPWLVRNWKVSGNMFGIAPYEALQDTVIHREDSFDRQIVLVPDSARIIRAAKLKFMYKFPEICEVNLRTMGNGLIICLFLVSVFHKFDREEVNQLKWCLVVVMILTAFVTAIFSAGSQGAFKPYLPLVIIYGVAFFFTVLERDEFADTGWKITMTSVLLLLSVLPVFFTVFGQKAHSPYPPYFPPFISYVSSLLGPDENMCTDIPWATAWYGKRTSFLLPESVDDFRKINDKVRINGLYLTTVTGNRPYNSSFSGGPWRSWLPILNGKVPKDFPLAHGISLPEGTHDQLFLTDRNRWLQNATNATAVTGQKK